MAVAAASEVETLEDESLWQRLKDNFKAGNLGSWPVILALWIVVAVFWQTAPNFATPANFTNLITQMAGTCLLAYGVIFVLLIGEIDLSIAFVSGIAGVVVARLQESEPLGPDLAWYICIAARDPRDDGDRRAPGVVRRPDRRSVVRRHAGRLARLAGRHPARGAGRGRDPGRHDQQLVELLLRRAGRLDHGGDHQHRVRRRRARRCDLPAAGTGSRCGTPSCGFSSSSSCR